MCRLSISPIGGTVAEGGIGVNKSLKIVILVVLDISSLILVYVLSLLFRFEFSFSSAQFQQYFTVFLNNMVWLLLIKIAVFAAMGLYSSIWKYASIDELARIVAAAMIANAFAVAYMVIVQQSFPRGVYAIIPVLDGAALGLLRMSYRWARYRFGGRSQPDNLLQVVFGSLRNAGRIPAHCKRVMVVGAGDAGAALIKEIRQNPGQSRRVIVAVDDDLDKLNQRIYNVRIAGNRHDIPALVQKYSIDEIAITMPSVSRMLTRDILEICNRTSCKVKILPAYIDLISEKVSIKALRDVDIEDMLGREPVLTDLEGISVYLRHKVVLVTGGAGSIGAELCRQIASHKPRLLVCVDFNENSIHEVTAEICAKYPELDFAPVIASVRNLVRMREVFSAYRPHVVFHAAAHKHVPLMEDNPKEAIVNNVLGTKHVMQVAEECGVSRFVMISTDKAVNPSNVMGATKRLAEMIVQSCSARSGVSFSVVRFGNVLASNGSVIPIFRGQIAAGGPVTVTHRDITRYFMTIPEAVQLVIQAGAMATGGEIFVLDMGEPVRILDLAEKIIRLSGYEPYEDIEIKITGLRPGEKLFEELLLAEEEVDRTAHEKIFVGTPSAAPGELEALLAEPDGLEAAVSAVYCMTDAEARQWLQRMVPTYSPADNPYI
jgi:FlaA1/EpsC-like NDP-sugar epimerase